MKHIGAVRATVVGALVVASAGLAVYFHVVLHTGVVYIHLAYVPIVLATVWWGRRGIVVAAVPAGVIVALRILDVGAGELWSDIVRVAFLFLVGCCVAVLSERLTAINRALRRSEGNYRALFERSLAGIMVYRNDRIFLSNERFSSMLGHRSEELKGMSIWDLVYEPDRPMVRNLVARRKAGIQADLHYECRFKKKDGTKIWVDLSSSPVDHLRRPAVLVNVYDITDRKESMRKQADRLFAPFYSTKNPGQGTGLGLSISLNIIKEHNGSIEAAGEPDKGARFTVRLPACSKARKRLKKAGNE